MVHSKICSYLSQEEGALIELTLVKQQEQQLPASVQASAHDGDRGENKRKRKKRKKETIEGKLEAHRDFAECGIKRKRSPERFLPRLVPTPFFSSLDAAAMMPKPA